VSMLDAVDLKKKFGKTAYKDRMQELDLRLAQLQRELRAAGIPVLVVFEGWDAAGKGSALGRLVKALDPRGFNVHFIAASTGEERLRPPMWRFWNCLPRDGNMAFFSRSWYREVLEERVDEDRSPRATQSAFERIRVFERHLVDGGAVIVKFFLHVSKKEQGKRFKKLGEDVAYAWKVSKAERRQHKHYKAYAGVIEEMLAETSTANAPWTVVPATDERFSVVQVAETLVRASEEALAARSGGPHTFPEMAPRETNPFDDLEPDVPLSEDSYGELLPELQEEVRRLQHLCYSDRVPVVMV